MAQMPDIKIRIVNDAGITSEMVEALDLCVESADSGYGVDKEMIATAREALRRLAIVVTGEAP